MTDRAKTYKLLAVCFHFPDKRLLTALKETPEFSALFESVTLKELRRAHNRVFSLTVGGGIPPYETEYGHRDIFMKTQRMADIAGFYRAFGLEVPEGKHERVDFIGAELELMSWLVLKEDHARASGRQKEAAICRDAARKFLNDHLGCWAPFLGEQILKVEDSNSFYGRLALKLIDFIDAECERLKVRPERITTWAPAPPPREPVCGIDETLREEGFSV